jgi:hypothetical protein
MSSANSVAPRPADETDRWIALLPRLRDAAATASEIGNLNVPPYFTPGIRWPSGAELLFGAFYTRPDGEREGSLDAVPAAETDRWLAGFWPDPESGLDAGIEEATDDDVIAFVGECDRRAGGAA